MIKLIEVGPRDGLQNESTFIPTNKKIEFIKNLYSAGLKNIEIASFVNPKSIPQMSDAKDVVENIQDLDFHKSVLVPNLKGYEIASKFNLDEISVFTTTSEKFCIKNTNCTIQESYQRINEIVSVSENLKIRGYLSTVFGCPYEGDISLEKVIEGIKNLFELGCYEVSLGDTTGIARPKQVRSYLNEILKEFPHDKIAMHFHDTRGLALSNVVESLERGVRIFDSSAGGLGGCPYAKGASGNLATEDLVSFLHGEGVKTGIDLKKLTLASENIFKVTQKQSLSKIHQLIMRECGI